MHIFGDRKFIEIPGSTNYELPPLLLAGRSGSIRIESVTRQASELITDSDLIPEILPPSEQLERQKFDLAINLTDKYLLFLKTWRWGDATLEWIKQCEVTFGCRPDLRPLIQPSIWPYCNSSNLVQLLQDKGVGPSAKNPEKLEIAVGLRLTFRKPPPMRCFSDQFLFYLESTIAGTAYQNWANPQALSLPPERFFFQVIEL